MAPAVRVALGCVGFGVFWVLAVFPAVPFLPIGRTAGSLLGAMLMVIMGVLSPDQAYAAIDLPILGLLFATMVVSVYLEKADLFLYLGKLLSWRSLGPKDLLLRVCLVSALSSALFTNDTCCVVLTEFVLKTARHHGLPPHPFLLALASSANIGSSATPIGNPQNLVIAVLSKISFLRFFAGLLPPMLLGVLLNAALLLAVYWRDLAPLPLLPPDLDLMSHRFSPATMSHADSLSEVDDDHSVNSLPVSLSGSTHTLRSRVGSPQAQREAEPELPTAAALSIQSENTADSEGHHNKNEKRRRMVWKACVYLVTLGMLIALLMGLNMSWTALTAALALIVLDFKDAMPCIEKVSYSLLLFFCGMFITVDGFNKTGVPGKLWDVMAPYSRIDHPAGISILAAVILLLSNLASNVPTVLLLGGKVAAAAAAISASDERKAWLILAWVSTVAGNLSLLGSAANLIVCEQARRAPHLGYNLTFWNHLKFGLPSTLIVTALGLTLIRG